MTALADTPKTATTELSYPRAVAQTEYRHAVAPLLVLFDDLPRTDLCTALGVFTPNAAFATTPAVIGTTDDGQVRLDGRVRTLPGARAVLLAATVDGELRLCLLDRPAPTGWLDLQGAPAAAVSRPVDRERDLTPVLDGYALAYSALAQERAAAVVADLRRTLAATTTTGPVLSTSQLVAHELTKLEIELTLLGGAVATRREPAAVLTAAVGLALRTAALHTDLTGALGLPDTEPLPAAHLHAHFGGARMAEAELARRMGMLREP